MQNGTEKGKKKKKANDGLESITEVNANKPNAVIKRDSKKKKKKTPEIDKSNLTR